MNASDSPAPRKPRIGITPEGTTDDGQFILPQEYLRAVQRAGGLPVMLPPWQEEVDQFLRFIDGLLLAGGGDIAPHRYGSAGHPQVYGVDDVRDAGELALFRAARQRGVPILEICRGAQLANVALGGTLVEHLPDRVAQPHRAVPKGGLLHSVCVPGGSRLSTALHSARAGLAGELRSIEVMSWHHQAIDRVAETLVVTARAEDGTIEAVETTHGAWMVAVQWHPELTAEHDPIQQNLFDAFVAVCKEAIQAQSQQ